MDHSIVTVVIQHHIVDGAAPQYEAWLNEIVPVAMGYTGHLGVNVIRPVGGSDIYTVVMRFDTHEHLRQWIESDTRRDLLARIEPLLARGEQLEIKTGLEYWFTPPQSSQKKASPFKQFLVTLSAIFPLTVLVPRLMAPASEAFPLLGQPLVGTFVVAVIIVFLMTYVIMPRYTRLIARWLFS